MLRFVPALVLCLAGSLGAEVRIHDGPVRLLAMPFGIEERIELKSIDAVHGGPEGEGRLVFTLRSSGVKKVVLRDPVFRLELQGPDGEWMSLGELRGSLITFPLTGEDRSVDLRHVAQLQSHLGAKDLGGHLRAAATHERPIRLVGHATMEVGKGDKVEFRKKDLKLELRGTTRLAEDFSAVRHEAAAGLPETGVH